VRAVDTRVELTPPYGVNSTFTPSETARAPLTPSLPLQYTPCTRQAIGPTTHHYLPSAERER